MPSRKLWEIAPHLSGPAGWRRLLFEMKVYSDESGRGQHPIFVMAGFIARAEQWADFDGDWQREVLDMEPRIDAFHMAEAVGAKDLNRIRAAGAVIRKHKFLALVVIIGTREYDLLVKGKVSRVMDNPYFAACLLMMELAIEWEIARGIDEPIDFIFDEQMFESDRLQANWTPFVNGLPDEIKRRFGQRPIHLNDAKHPGLQAADMLAWSCRRPVHSDPPDEFLRGIFKGIRMRRAEWNAKTIAGLMARVKQVNERLGRYTHYEMEDASERRDILFSIHNREAMAEVSPGETVPLVSIPAKGIGRFLLVHSCPQSRSPHLHRRSGDECLAGKVG